MASLSKVSLLNVEESSTGQQTLREKKKRFLSSSFGSAEQCKAQGGKIPN